MGRVVIVVRGKILCDETSTQGFGQNNTPQYEITLTDPKLELARSGNRAAGSSVFRQTAIVNSVSSLPASEILREPVVCEQTWALVASIGHQ